MYALGIEAFLAIIKNQSLSKAAESLHLAQTTMSQRLKILEQELGLVLIDRGKGIKKIRLTAAGEEFFKLAEQWNYIWQEAKLLQSHGPKLSLSVGAVDSINTLVLPPVYSAFNNHPAPIKLQIHTSHSVELYSAVETRQVDIAFVLRDLIHPNVKVSKCISCAMVVLRVANNNSSHAPLIHPEDLDADNELFMPFGGREYVSWHEHWWNPLAPSRVRLDNINLLFSLLQTPKQWAIVPKIVAQAAMQRGQYSISHLTYAPPNYTCYKITHTNPTSLVKQALEIFEQYFKNIVLHSS